MAVIVGYRRGCRMVGVGCKRVVVGATIRSHDLGPVAIRRRGWDWSNDARLSCAMDKTTADTVACDIVASMLDYCSAPLAGMSETNLNKSQRTKNNLARMITSTGRLEHIKPVLTELHRLPISFKMAKTDSLGLKKSPAILSRRPHRLLSILLLLKERLMKTQIDCRKASLLHSSDRSTVEPTRATTCKPKCIIWMFLVLDPNPIHCFRGPDGINFMKWMFSVTLETFWNHAVGKQR